MAGSKTGSKTDTTEGKGKVYVTIHKLGSEETLTFEDGDTLAHMIKAVGASADLELRISGKDVREMDKDTQLGSLKDQKSQVHTQAAPRRGSHG